LEALRRRHFDCFVFHDVDLLPLDERHPYSCARSPTHLGAYMNKFEYRRASASETLFLPFIMTIFYLFVIICCYCTAMNIKTFLVLDRMPWGTFFGGAVAFSADDMRRINGFSNRFYGWGGEDDDSFNRYTTILTFSSYVTFSNSLICQVELLFRNFLHWLIPLATCIDANR
jgi:beta-1,4-galactosyltransferase 1